MNRKEKLLKIIDTAYLPLENVHDPKIFTLAIGMILDQWLADHGIPQPEGDTILQALLTARAKVYEEIGNATPREHTEGRIS